jgi:hypothetical protein
MNLTYPVGTIGSVTFLLAATLHQELDRVHCSKASITLFQAIERRLNHEFCIDFVLFVVKVTYYLSYYILIVSCNCQLLTQKL